MHKKRFIIPILLTILFYGTYIIAGIFHSDYWSNILSPIVGMIAFVMVIRNYLSFNQNLSHKIIWFSFSFACLTWAFADTIWAFYYFLPDLEPEKSQMLVYLYTLPNIFLGLAIFTAAYLLFKKWNALQLFLDSITIATSTLFLIWIIFFNKSTIMIDIITKDGWPSILSISTDMLILAVIVIWYLSIRKGTIYLYIRFITTGSLLYVLVDLYYYYIYFNNLYLPNSIIDFIYLGSFVLIAIGAILNYFYKFSASQDTFFHNNYNVGFTKKHWLLLICPILSFVFEGFVISDLLIFFLVILFNKILGMYVQTYNEHEQLLIKEKEMNIILEEKIKERTKEIIEKNQQLEHKNKELNFLSKQDTVTTLYNRRFFIKSLKKELANLKPPETIALLFIDLDRFKMINDMYGHHIGDQVLIEIARRLEAFNNGDSMLARLGGDEFVMGYTGKFDYKHMELIANEIIDACSKAIEIEQYRFHVTTSIGISIYPLDAADSNTLMKNADIAMYQAKAQGKRRCVSFDSKFKENLNRKNEIEFQLKKAVYDNEFEVYYQPQFSIPDQRLIGAEALLRWNNDFLGWVLPAEFIPVAEEIDLINSIGEWVMEKAIIQIGIWNKTFDSNLKVGINVSPKQLDYKDFISNFENIMKKYAVSSKNIDIELTENIAIEGEDRIKQIDSLFRGLGVSISIDDFGTGYSSLSYLKLLPFDRIKIAKPLIDAISIDNYDLQIVKAVIMLAKSIGMKTIAEGVELQEQYDILVDLQCDEIQGYFLGKPVPVKQFNELFIH